MSAPRPKGAAQGADARATAAVALGAVLAGQGNLKSQLERAFDAQESLSDLDRRFATQLAFGTARVALRLIPLLDSALKHPLKPRDQDVRALMLSALYQIHWLGAAAPLCVNGAVDATRALHKPWASKLVNAVLRKFPADLLAAGLAKQSPAEQSGLPPWWYAAWAKAWGPDLPALIDASNSEPPLTLRVDGDRDAVLKSLQDAGIKAVAGALGAQAIYLPEGGAPASLPGFATGTLTVQDEGAQLITELLELAPGQRILDACAAPGGKASAILATCKGLSLTAIDPAAHRVARLKETLARTASAVKAGDAKVAVYCADARVPGPWQGDSPFDRILVDAPCSGSGILRRQPDIRLLRTPEELAKLRALQLGLLKALFPLLQPGGRLVYCTCSVMPEEGEGVVKAFLSSEPAARARPLPDRFGRLRGPGRQRLPTATGPDGFFYAVLEKEGDA